MLRLLEKVLFQKRKVKQHCVWTYSAGTIFFGGATVQEAPYQWNL